MVLILAISVDPDKMQHYSAFHLGLDVCQNTLLGVYKGLMKNTNLMLK